MQLDKYGSAPGNMARRYLEYHLALQKEEMLQRLLERKTSEHRIAFF
jgi:hypothetical protein